MKLIIVFWYSRGTNIFYKFLHRLGAVDNPYITAAYCPHDLMLVQLVPLGLFSGAFISIKK
jgi:hypothetical protein